MMVQTLAGGPQVNNQMVVGSLMNLCDDPNRVSTSQNWRENDVIRRCA